MRPRALVLATMLAGPACGGETPPAPAPSPAPATAPPTTRRFVLDAAYAQQHGYALPARIALEVPAGQLRHQSPPAEQRVFLRLDAVGDGGRPSEDLMLTSLTIPPGEPDQRRTFTAELLEKDALWRTIPREGESLGVRDLEVAGFPALQVRGQFDAPNSGRVYASVIAVLLPEPPTIAIMSHHVADTSGIRSADEIGRTGLLAAVLASLEIDP
jgi:hypothetical protein